MGIITAYTISAQVYEAVSPPTVSEQRRQWQGEACLTVATEKSMLACDWCDKCFHWCDKWFHWCDKWFHWCDKWFHWCGKMHNYTLCALPKML